MTLVALGLAVAGGAVGCAQERDPINRVQPQALRKSWFVGDLKDPTDDPEFYARAMVIDAGYGVSQDLVFTNTINMVGRIKWSIEEDMLVGRSSIERVPGSDAKGNGGGKDNDGVVAYAYRITSHFDVRRDYNPATGEETNVIGENMMDRPWYEREYFRVDWSRNLNARSYDFDTLAWMTGVVGVSYESLGWSDTDQARYPDSKPQFDTIDKDGYFDVTNRVLVTPGTIALPAAWGGGSYPACFISDVLSGGTAPVGMCNPAEMVVRQSFLRVDPKQHDYEPMSWDGRKFEVAGAFTTDRNGFARNYGMTDDRQTWLINRYNIWKNAHYYTDAANLKGEVACNTVATTPFGANPNRDDNADGTEDECEAVTTATGVGGSRCDVISKKCTLPFRKRDAKPLAWYDSNDSDPRYAQGSAWATHEWDVALRMAVTSARYAECMATDKQDCDQYPVVRGQLAEAEDLTFLTREIDACRQGETERKDCDALADELADKRGYSETVKKLAKAPEMVVFCHKAKTAEQLAAWNAKWGMKAEDKNYWVESVCGDIKTKNPRAGDMRYNLITSVMTPQTPSPWGIMTDAHDPLTGEVISTSANVWTYINDIWSQGAIDQLRYMYGELSTQDVTEGKYIEEWSVAAAQASRGGAVMPTFSRDQVDARLASAANVSVEEFRARAARFAGDQRLQALKQQVKDQVAQVAAGEGATSVNAPVVKARKDRLLGTSVEAALTTPAMQSVFDKDTRAALGQMPTAGMASPLRGLDPKAIREMRRAWQSALADRGVCFMNEMPSPMGYIGLGNILQDKFGKFDKTQPKQAQYDRAEKMRSYVGQTAHYAVMTHEMGHSIGLRHNFVSSSDSWNYRPQYWQLRTNNKAVTAECTTATADGRTCVGPRYFDPVTDNEAKNLIQMWMHSSTMEYAGEPTQDFLGLGAYDYHAAELFYADSVHVYTDSGYRRTAAGGRAAMAKMDQFGGLIGFDYQNVNHYSALDKTYNMILDCKPVADVNAFKPVNWNEELHGKWNPVLDGHIVTDESGKYSRCKQQQVDHVQYRLMKDNPSASFSQNKHHAYDAQSRVRVPYGFATDNWADLGNVAVYRHDNGGDFYEQIAFWITQMETGHIFDNYRRSRSTFSIRGAYGRALGRYFEKMRDGGKGMGLYYNIYRMILGDQGVDFDGAWPSFLTGLEANVMASGMAFDTFTRLFQRPQAGAHAMVTDFNGKVLRSSDDSSFDSDIGSAGDPVVVQTNQLTIPNGATGMQDAANPNFRSISWGGRPLNNALADNYEKGDYASQFTTGVGSYYEKSFVPLMLTESEDNFISSSRRDFFDPRWRNISMADIFPEGFRRFMAHNLADDDTLRGVRVAADANGNPLRTNGFPTNGLSFTQWWPSAGPSACFPGANSFVCSRDQVSAGSSLQPADFGALTFNNVAIVEPQVAIEQQKFLIVHTLTNLPVNSMTKWMDQMRVFAAPHDDPSAIPAASRIEFHNPNGFTYFAKSHGKETVFGKSVHRGIAARVLEHANALLDKAYVTTKVTNGQNTWFVPVVGSNGRPLVKFQGLAESVSGCRAVTSTNAAFSPNANFGTAGAASLAEYEAAYAGCAISSNQAAIALEKYVTVPDFLRTAIEMTYGADLRGVY
jgi:hypothetical protein